MRQIYLLNSSLTFRGHRYQKTTTSLPVVVSIDQLWKFQNITSRTTASNCDGSPQNKLVLFSQIYHNRRFLSHLALSRQKWCRKDPLVPWRRVIFLKNGAFKSAFLKPIFALSRSSGIIFGRDTIVLLQLYQSVKIVRNKTFKLVVAWELYSEQLYTSLDCNSSHKRECIIALNWINEICRIYYQMWPWRQSTSHLVVSYRVHALS